MLPKSLNRKKFVEHFSRQLRIEIELGVYVIVLSIRLDQSGCVATTASLVNGKQAFIVLGVISYLIRNRSAKLEVHYYLGTLPSRKCQDVFNDI